MPNACREACQAAYKSSVQRCFDVLTQGLQTATTADEINQQKEAFQKCRAICEQALEICLETCGAADEEIENPPVPGNLLQVQRATFVGVCGEAGPLHSIFNRSNTDQRYTIIVRNTGDHCNIEVFSSPMPPENPNPLDIVGVARPGVAGSTVIDVPSGSGIQLHWQCSGTDTNHECSGEFIVYQHT